MTRIAYLECSAGISGDMLLGALLDAGAPLAAMQQAVAAMNVGAMLAVEKTDRCGITSTRARVLVDGKDADSAHKHEHGHSHHSHGRSLTAIRKMIHAAALPARVQATSIAAFEILGHAEAKIHNRPVDSIHFHEVGAVDAIADIVAASAGVQALQIDSWICSPLNVGGGTVECAHGRYPVPAPATAELLLGAPTYSSGAQLELVTPTGAALIRALHCSFGSAPAMRVSAIGYGTGSHNPPGFANVLRLSLGESDSLSVPSADTIIVLETAIDDLNPQILGDVTERLLQAGALDVMCAPVQMKKNRPGTLLTVLCDREHAAALQHLLFRETSSLGIRIREERRALLQRSFAPVQTPWGEVRIKLGLLNGEAVNAAPEYEDCRRCAEAHSIPLKIVMQTALALYHSSHPR